MTPTFHLRVGGRNPAFRSYGLGGGREEEAVGDAPGQIRRFTPFHAILTAVPWETQLDLGRQLRGGLEVGSHLVVPAGGDKAGGRG